MTEFEDIELDELLEKPGRKILYRKENIRIDMNPMVDLAFLLITFFMLTTTFSKPQAMEITMPVQPNDPSLVQEQAIKESKVMSLVLDEQGQGMWYMGLSMAEPLKCKLDSTGLRVILLQKHAEIPELMVLLKPMKRSPFKSLVNAIDELRLARVDRYAIVDLEKQDLNIIGLLEDE